MLAYIRKNHSFYFTKNRFYSFECHILGFVLSLFVIVRIFLLSDWKNMSGCNSAKLTDESNANQCCIETQYLINNVLTIQDNIDGLLTQSITGKINVY